MKLKRCPFCGGKASFVKDRWENTNHYGHDIYIACYKSNCPVNPITREYHREDYAIKAWNRRNA